MKPTDPEPVDFQKVLAEELREIETARRLRNDEAVPADGIAAPAPGQAIEEAHGMNLAGLAFSGGGIRSATFNLGVLQKLAGLGLLRRFDYLSTVSGGGYIGSWFAAWVKRANLEEVIGKLSGQTPAEGEKAEGPDQVRFLRRFSNYLTPRLGIFGADAWTVATTWLSNTLLNQVILIAALAALLLVPRLLALTWQPFMVARWTVGLGLAAILGLWGGLALRFERRSYLIVVAVALLLVAVWLAVPKLRPTLASLGGVALPGLLLVFAIGWVILNLSSIPDPDTPRTDSPAYSWTHCPRAIIAYVVAPTFLAAWFGTRYLWLKLRPDLLDLCQPLPSSLPSLMLFVLGLVILAWGWLVLWEFRERLFGEAERKPPAGWKLFIRLVSFFLVLVGVLFLSVRFGEYFGLLARLGTNAWLLWALCGGAAYFGLWCGGWALGALLAKVMEKAGLETQPAAGPATGKPSWKDKRKVLFDKARATSEIFMTKVRARSTRMVAIFAFLAGVSGGVLARGLTMVFCKWWNSEGGNWHALAFGPPLMIGVFSLVVMVHIGLMGRDYPDYLREWWRRLGAWLLIFGVAWVGIFSLALYGPLGLIWAGPKLKALLGSGWLLATISGIVAGRSAATGRQNANRWVELLAKLTPYVFALGLLLFLSLGIHQALLRIVPSPPIASEQMSLYRADIPFSFLYGLHWKLTSRALDLNLVLYFLGCLAVAALLSWRVDINEFSMHNLYRNRLVRCYLGASRAQNRRAQPFSGFDPEDDLFLAHLVSTSCQVSTRAGAYDGPYPLINTTLNLVHGEELAWQERKAASFVFTPRYCGYERPRPQEQDDPCARDQNLQDRCFRPTSRYSGEKGIHLGKAMAISGAAATPNMGFHTSAPLAFLMTVFNVRLGWWLGNPRHQESWKYRGPRLGLTYLLAELFGQTDDKAKYVYLSDGGHFENLGLYELVRRRCRYILVCDAEEDREMKFGALGNAIRKCRTDFGIEVDIDLDPIRRDVASGRSRWHCAVGTIHYENVDDFSEAQPGTLIYLKSSLTGDEPADVLNYQSAHDDFPHQTTVDQWFDESQFESYRMLGHHIAETTFEPAQEQIAAVDLEGACVRLSQVWLAPAPGDPVLIARHRRALDHLFERLSKDENLRFLDAQIYPEWGRLSERATPKPPTQLWLPEKYEELRAGLYFSNKLIKLMETVYLDLNLEQEFDHPDNRGWMNLFRHWSWSGMFRVAWAVSASTHGARFQTFCQRHLDLDIRKQVRVGPAAELTAEKTASQEVVARLESQRVLNFLEVQILNAFLDEGLIDVPHQVHPFVVTVREPMGPGREVSFTFGFALVRLETSGSTIRYFRVQDHLRKTGLARAAMKALVEVPGIKLVGVREGVPRKHGPEIPSREDLERLKQLYESVRREKLR